MRQLVSAAALQILHKRQVVRWFQGQIGQAASLSSSRGLQAGDLGLHQHRGVQAVLDDSDVAVLLQTHGEPVDAAGAAIEAALGLQTDLVAGAVELAFHWPGQLEACKLGRNLVERRLHRVRRDFLQPQEQGDGIVRNLPGSPIFTGLPGKSWSKQRLSPTVVTSSSSSMLKGPRGEKSVAFPPDDFHADRPVFRPQGGVLHDRSLLKVGAKPRGSSAPPERLADVFPVGHLQRLFVIVAAASEADLLPLGLLAPLAADLASTSPLTSKRILTWSI